MPLVLTSITNSEVPLQNFLSWSFGLMPGALRWS